jgi:hypothetical protein
MHHQASNKFWPRYGWLVRILIGFVVGVLLGGWKMGWQGRSAPLIFEYGVIVGALVFALQNYLQFRKRLLAKVEADRTRTQPKP